MRKLIITLLIALLTLTSSVIAQEETRDENDDETMTIELSEELTLTDDNTLAYPEGWFASEQEGYIVVSNDETMMDIYINGEPAQSVESGQVLMSIQVIPLASVEDRTLVEVAEVVSNDLIETVTNEFDINGTDAASISGVSAAGSGIPLGGYILALDEQDNGYIVLTVALTASGEQEDIADIVNTITYSLYGDVEIVEASDTSDNLSDIEPLELTQELIFTDGTTLMFPETWQAQEQYGTAVLVSDPYLIELIEAGLDPEAIEPGQVFATVELSPSAQLAEGQLLEFAESVSFEMLINTRELKEFELDGKATISVSGEVVEGDLNTGTYVLLVDDEENGVIISVFAITAPGEQEIAGMTLQAIAQSVVPASDE